MNTTTQPSTEGSTVVQHTASRYNQATIQYRKQGDTWEVKTPTDDEYWEFAVDCKERDVIQLINKKWNRDYTTSPDDLSDRS